MSHVDTSHSRRSCDFELMIETTRRMLERRYGNELSAAEQTLILHMVQGVAENTKYAVRVEWSDSMLFALSKIFVSSRDLAHSLRRQSACFEIWMPSALSSNGTPFQFDWASQEDINEADDGDMTDQKVEMSLFPAVIKWGDERGENVSLDRHKCCPY